MDPNELGDLRRVCARISARTEIRDVRFEAIQGELVGELVSGRPLSFEMKPSASQGGLDGDHFGVVAEYVVSINQAAERSEQNDEQDAEEVAAITIRIAGLFRIDLDAGSEPFDLGAVSSEELEAYARSTGLFALHPYARQAISSLSMQLGLPVLQIPVLKITTGEMGD